MTVTLEGLHPLVRAVIEAAIEETIDDGFNDAPDDCDCRRCVAVRALAAAMKEEEKP